MNSFLDAFLGTGDYLSSLPPTYENLRNTRQPTPMEAKVTAARAWLAQREAERGPHRYSSVPTVLLPVAQRRVQREQERRT